MVTDLVSEHEQCRSHADLWHKRKAWRPQMAFDHEKLDVYQLAVDFVARANDIVESLRMLTKLVKVHQ